jgi:hypothetical protein
MYRSYDNLSALCVMVVVVVVDVVVLFAARTDPRWT